MGGHNRGQRYGRGGQDREDDRWGSNPGRQGNREFSGRSGRGGGREAEQNVWSRQGGPSRSGNYGPDSWSREDQWEGGYDDEQYGYGRSGRGGQSFSQEQYRNPQGPDIYERQSGEYGGAPGGERGGRHWRGTDWGGGTPGGERSGRYWRGTDWEGAGGRSGYRNERGYGQGGQDDLEREEYRQGGFDREQYGQGGYDSEAYGSRGPRQQSRRGMQGGRFSGKGPKGYQRSDERIREDVSEALSQHGEIDASEIEVQVRGGEVTLTGTIDNREAKRAAEEAAEQCSGVKDVQNRIRVQSGSMTGHSGQGGMTQGPSGHGGNDRDAESKSKSRSSVGSTS